ncbi:MAG: response regulator [Eubacterium sp.]|jgi:two-component system response regulator YesN|nr:response regulator [Eubacterium sp.]
MADEILKVMLVEDERLVLELLKACIKWDEIGYQIVGESSSAVNAIELVDTLLPDVIITDICMPVMDGLEFSKRVSEKHPNIKIIVLTGHEEFEFAKKGIKVGISDFLLKPINDDEITRALTSLKEKIIKERTFSVGYEKLKKQLEQNLPFLREKLFNELIQGGFDITSIYERLSYFDIKINQGGFRTAVIEVEDLVEANKGDEEHKLINKMRCLDYIQRFFEKDNFVSVFFDNSQRIVVLCNNGSIDMSECCETIKSMLLNRLKCFITIGIGNIHNGIDKIYMSYKEACDAISYKFVVGKNQIVSFSDIWSSTNENVRIDNDSMGRFGFYIKSGLREKAEEIIDLLFGEADSQIKSLEQARVIACNLISAIMNIIMESDINQKDIFKNNLLPFEKIFKLDTLPDIKHFLKDTAATAAQSVNSQQGKKARKILQDVKEYIHNNYTDSNISLSEVAKKFYLNLSYLSRIFKEETGQTFVDYLMKLRMERAFKLLGETDLMVYQIAEMVGINDSHYFSICFKKYTGLSANDYRKSI